MSHEGEKLIEFMKALIDNAFLEARTKLEFMEKVTAILSKCKSLGAGFEEVEAYALKKADAWELEKR